MPPNSFNINSRLHNCYEMWGMKIISYDTFSAPKRPRRKQLPFQHGTRKLSGQSYFSDKTIEVDCHLTRHLPKAELREIIAILVRPMRLFFWDEPDKYYIAELFAEVDVDVFPSEVRREFTLPFIAEPFAYGEQNRVRLHRGINYIDYTGTAEAPTLIVLRNVNNHNIVNPTVTSIERISD